jgi:hypothetical protein
MPVKKKTAVAKKNTKASPKKAVPAKKKTAAPKKPLILSPLPIRPISVKKMYTVYIGASAIFPMNSEDGWTDLFQEGRCTAVPNRDLHTPIVIPVGATLNSLSIHYINTTANPVLCLFMRLHADRFSPSGECEMSYINLPPAILPEFSYPTVTDDSFPDSNIIQDRFMHYLELHGTGDFGAAGKITIRGISYTYTF